MMKAALDPFFYPCSVAVAGVSTSEENFGKRIIENLVTFGFKGRIYPVGRGGGEVFGLNISRGIGEVEGDVDLLVLLVPREMVLPLMKEGIERGIRSFFIPSGGFQEFAGIDDPLSREILKLKDEHEIRILGPNGLGTINMENGLCLPFSTLRPLRRGGVSIVSQSGGIGLSLINLLHSEGIGINKFASIGNKLDIDENDLVPYLSMDRGTEVMVLYLESFVKGRELLERIYSSEKPVILYKGNRGELSGRIAMTHTAALSSSQGVADSLLEETPALNLKSTRDILTAIKGLLHAPVHGSGVTVLSRSGGHAVIASDLLERHSFSLPPIPERLERAILARMRAGIIDVVNPVDLGTTFDFSAFVENLKDTLSMTASGAILFLMIYSTPQPDFDIMELSKICFRLEKSHNRPIFFVFVGWEEDIRALKEKGQFPIFDTVEEAVQAMAFNRDFHAAIQKRPGRVPPPIVEMKELPMKGVSEEGILHPLLSRNLLREEGIPFPPSITVDRMREPSETMRALDRLPGEKFVLKFLSSSIPHKTEAGGVVTDLERGEVIPALKEMESRFPEGMRRPGDTFLIETMAGDGEEIIVGCRRERDFGEVLLIGWGGILAEKIAERVIRLAPIDYERALSAIFRLRGATILKGFRGRGPLDYPSLARLITGFSTLLFKYPVIEEAEINPVRVLAEDRGVVALDARIRCRGGDGQGLKE